MGFFEERALLQRDRILRRLGMKPPFPHDGRFAAVDEGQMSGIAPIGKAADYLEEVANQLPH
jgi:hypothetical protein